MARTHGRIGKGQMLRMSVPHGHWKTTTFVAGLRLTGMVAPMVLDEPINRKRSFCAGRSGLTSAFIQAARALTGCAAFQAQGMSSSIRLFVWPLTIRVRTSVR